MLPVVLCIDVEPDRRLPTEEALPLLGFEALAGRIPAVRARLASVLGHTPHLTWALRMDPHIEVVYGSAAWVADTYRPALDAMLEAGDALGIHPHTWRREPGGWWNDNADAAWVREVVATSLDAYERSFGDPCRVTRCGDRFLTSAVAAQLQAAGVVVDLTVEPGLEAAARLADDEPTRGALPDTRSAPLRAYRMATTDICLADPSREGALVELPLSPGVVVAAGEPPALAAGSFRTLTLWTEPERFAQQLERRLLSPELTHLAFAIRTDIAMLPGPWAAVEANLDHLARTLGGSAAFVTALEAVDAVRAGLGAAAPARATDAAASQRWALGALDPGAVEGLDPAVALAQQLPAIRWLQGTVTAGCPACGTTGLADRVAQTIPQTGAGVEAQRCRTCRSVHVVGPHVGQPTVPPHLEAARVEAYVEQLGAVEVIAATLAAAGPRPPGSRLLDIGCGYGFGLAVADGLWGWDGAGVDPGPEAAAGGEQLGHRLHRALFATDLDLGGPADVILASEVIEHVPDPNDLLRSVRHHLAADGVLVLTTPDADAVAPERSLAEVLPAIGVGAHICLLSEGALEDMLRAAGFAGVRIVARGATLHAVATPLLDDLPAVDDVAPYDLPDIAAWAHARAEAAPPGSALRLGLAARAARLFMHSSELDRAWEAREVLAEVLEARHGVALDDPDATSARTRSGNGVPVVVADAHLTSGVLHLHAGRHHPAAAHLLAAADVAADNAPRSLDPSLRWMEAHALGQAATALAHADPDQVVPTIRRLVDVAPQVAGVVDTTALIGRAFTELVAAGHHAAADRLRELVPPPSAAALELGGESRRAALDALFMRSVLDLGLGRATAAAHGFRETAELAATADDEHSQHLADRATAHARVADAAAMAGSASAAEPRRSLRSRVPWSRSGR